MKLPLKKQSIHLYSIAVNAIYLSSLSGTLINTHGKPQIGHVAFQRLKVILYHFSEPQTNQKTLHMR